MRIIAGAWRGRALVAPPGLATRPTAERVRQALFDMLTHAPWGGAGLLREARVLDGFAGTGALGLEALSRGAAHVSFIERDRAALAALRANVAACRAGERCTVLPMDAMRPPRAEAPCGLVFLDPPYGADLVARGVASLRDAGWLAPGCVIVAECGRDEKQPAIPGSALLAEREHGAARIAVLRME